MYTTFTEDSTLIAENIGKQLGIKTGPANLVIGKTGADDFGGGTLNVLKRLEGGGNKIISTYASAEQLPVFLPGIGPRGVDVELVGSVNPNLYVELGPA